MAGGEDDFTVVLPSTSNLGTHPSNRPDDYTVRLHRTYDMSQNDWEVAVLSAQFPYNWYNLTEDVEIKFAYIPELPEPKPASAQGAYERLKALIFHRTSTPHTARLKLDMGTGIVPRGQYATVDELGAKVCESFNRKRYVLSDAARLSFEYDKERRTGRFTLSTSPVGAVVLLFPSARLPGYLGFETTEVPVTDLIFGGPWPSAVMHMIGMQGTKPAAQLSTIDSIYLYSSVSKYQAVGDTEAPLLGIIPVTGVCGQRQQWTFNPLLYVGVNQARLNEIRIMLRTEQGARVPFLADCSSVVCCLHFRRRKIAI